MKIRQLTKRGKVSFETKTEANGTLAKDGRSQPGAVPVQLERILVPIDFSRCSIKALQYAIPFARQCGASLTLLHVIPVAHGADEFSLINFPFPEKEIHEQCQMKLRALAKAEIGGKVPVVALVRVGRPVKEIVASARALETDLIIIATHGRTGLKHILMGSTAEEVVRRATCPVLVVREEEHEFIHS